MVDIRYDNGPYLLLNRNNTWKKDQHMYDGYYPFQDQDLVNKLYVDEMIPVATAFFFYKEVMGDYPSCYKMQLLESTNPSQTISYTDVVDNQILTCYITNIGKPNMDYISEGTHKVYIRVKKDNIGSKDLRVYWKLFKIDAALSTETLLITSGMSNLIPTDVVNIFIIPYYNDEISLLSTDRLILKIYANVTGGGMAPDVSFYVEGNSDARYELPVSIAGLSSVFVPYSNAKFNVDLGSFNLTANRFISTVATGTAPLSVASTTKVDNLNVDMLDGKHVGTSGNTVPLLDGANTWSGNQLFGADGAGVDVTFNTLTSGSNLFWDASEGQLTLTVVPGKEYQFQLAGIDDEYADIFRSYFMVSPVLGWTGPGAVEGALSAFFVGLSDGRNVTDVGVSEDFLLPMQFLFSRVAGFTSAAHYNYAHGLHFSLYEYMSNYTHDAAEVTTIAFNVFGIGWPVFTGSGTKFNYTILNVGPSANIIAYNEYGTVDLVFKGVNVEPQIFIDPGSATATLYGLYYAATTYELETNYAVYALYGDIALANDATRLLFGAGLNAGLYYDGTNLNVDPKLVGSGILDVHGVLQTDGYNSADGSPGATQDVVVQGPLGNLTLSFKDGLFIDVI